MFKKSSGDKFKFYAQLKIEDLYNMLTQFYTRIPFDASKVIRKPETWRVSKGREWIKNYSF